MILIQGSSFKPEVHRIRIHFALTQRIKERARLPSRKLLNLYLDQTAVSRESPGR